MACGTASESVNAVDDICSRSTVWSTYSWSMAPAAIIRSPSARIIVIGSRA